MSNRTRRCACIRLLGSAGLLDAGGEPLAPVLRQPKRFALLAWLAAAGDGYAPQPRETLQALFWPELDQAAARNALAQALHFLRQELGAAALPALGRVAVAVSRDHVVCDVAELKLARAVGRTRDVAELYTGPLLPGFNIDNAPDFARWADEERLRLAQHAAAAAAALATDAAAAGDLAEAVHWSRRALEILPEDEQQLRRLLTLLDRAGDRAGALALESAFRQRLQEDYGVAPSVETDELVRAIRTRQLAHAAGDAATPSSVAVLPFQDMSAAPVDTFFADGLAEELIAILAGVDGLHVVSRTSAFTYRNSDLPLRQIARELGVETIVEGSVRRAGERVRITAQLIDARTDAHLWAETYERAGTDVFQIQFDVADRIAAALRHRFTPEQGRRAVARATTNIDALHAYLRGRHLSRSGDPATWAEGVAALRRAIDIDAGYAAAHAALANAYMLPELFYLSPPISRMEARQHARTAALRALELAPDLAEAHVTLSMVQWYNWEWSESDASIRRAITLQPAFADAHHQHGLYLIHRGRFDEAEAALARAQELDPLSLATFISRGLLALRRRDFDEAIVLLKRALEIDPRAHAATHYLAEAYVFSGRYERVMEVWDGRPDVPLDERTLLRDAYEQGGATAAIEHTLRIVEKAGGSPSIQGGMQAMLGNADTGFRLLRQGLRERDPVLADGIRNHPGFDAMRGDPRFAEALDRMNIPRHEAWTPSSPRPGEEP